MKFLLFLEADLALLSTLQIAWSRNDGCGRYNLNSSQVVTVQYWRARIMDKAFVQRLLEESPNEKEIFTLIKIGKTIADIDAFNGAMNSTHLQTFIHVVEVLHNARFERRLLYLRNNPQLLLEAKAELREKKSIAMKESK